MVEAGYTQAEMDQIQRSQRSNGPQAFAVLMTLLVLSCVVALLIFG